MPIKGAKRTIDLQLQLDTSEHLFQQQLIIRQEKKQEDRTLQHQLIFTIKYSYKNKITFSSSNHGTLWYDLTNVNT